MKFLQKDRIVYLRSVILMLGIGLMSVNQAQSIDSIIGFSSNRDSRGVNRDIFVMKSDWTEVCNLWNNPVSMNSAPAWSADGQIIAFESTDPHGDTDFFVMDADGKTLSGLLLTQEWTAFPTSLRRVEESPLRQ